MASNYTENFHLSQWEADDEVLRTDFNADNAAIEAALTGMMDVYSPRNKPFVAGWYEGNGAATRVISLGFTPSAVVMTIKGGQTYASGSGYTHHLGGVTVQGAEVGENGLQIVEGGFRVVENNNAWTNHMGLKYNYIAFR